MPDPAALPYALAALILAYKVGRWLVRGEQGEVFYAKDWL